MRDSIALSATMLFIVFGAWTANMVCAHPELDTAMAVSPMTVARELPAGSDAPLSGAFC